MTGSSLGALLALFSAFAWSLPASGGGDAVVNSLGMRMVLVPAGTFRMGSPAGEPMRQEEEAPRRVTLTRAFRIAATEVTQKQWLALMPSNPSPQKGDDLPVTSVSWKDAQAFCLALSEKEGVRYRLPTEAEWEYACRAGGDEAPAGRAELEAAAWFADNSRGGDAPRRAEAAERVGPSRRARERGRVDAGRLRPLPARRGGRGPDGACRRVDTGRPRRLVAQLPAGAALRRPGGHAGVVPAPARRPARGVEAASRRTAGYRVGSFRFSVLRPNSAQLPSAFFTLSTTSSSPVSSRR